MSAVGSRGSNNRKGFHNRTWQEQFDMMWSSYDLTKPVFTEGVIIEVCGPENSAGVPKSWRGTKGISFIVDTGDPLLGIIEVDCRHSEAELRQNFGSDANLIGRKCKIESRGKGKSQCSQGHATIICDQEEYYVDVRKTGPCSLGSMNGVTVSDPLGRLMCFLTGSEGPYSGEK